MITKCTVPANLKEIMNELKEKGFCYLSFPLQQPVTKISPDGEELEVMASGPIPEFLRNKDLAHEHP